MNWTIAQLEELQRLKELARKILRDDHNARAYTEAYITDESFHSETRCSWRFAGGDHPGAWMREADYEITLRQEFSATLDKDIYLLKYDASDEAVECVSFSLACEVIETRLQDTAEYVGVRV